MLTVSVVLLPLVLAEFWQDELIVARYAIFYALSVGCPYLIFYIRQRIRIDAPTPFLSLFVMIGYGIMFATIAAAATGIYWQPTLALIAALGYWGLFSSAVIFISFLAEFVTPGEKRT